MRQARLGALAYKPCLKFGDVRHAGENEPAHCAADVGHIAKQNLNAAVEQREHETNIAGERVELGDDEFCFLFFAGGQRRLELRAFRSLAAFNLSELAGELPRTTVEPLRYKNRACQV